MKKALAMALGAVLVAGSAAPASAASQIDFTGFYGARYAVNGNAGFTGEDNLNESFFESRFQVDVTFQATDEVSVIWRLRGPAGERWGTNRSDSAPTSGIGDRQARNITTRYVYGQVVQDWGTVRVGRLSGGLGDAFGLQDLGWTPLLDKYNSSIGPFDGLGEYDSIQYQNKWDNGFGLTATYQKIAATAETDAWTERVGSDHDHDRFQIQPTYQWETGGVALNTYYERNATANPLADRNALGYAADANDVSNIWYINPAFVQNWGAFGLHFEGMAAIGDISRTDLTNGDSVNDIDVDAQAFYLDFNYNYGPGRVNLAGWWVSGNDVDDDDDDDNREDNSLATLSTTSFYPLAVAYAPAADRAYYEGPSSVRGGGGAVGAANAGSTFVTNANVISSNGITGSTVTLMSDLNTAPGGTLDLGRNTLTGDFARGNGHSNHWALMLSGQHAFTDEITFNYALAYLALVNPNYKIVDRFAIDSTTQSGGIGYHTQDKDLGWEIDLGVNVQLLDNLAFSSTVGYMFTGDAYQQLKGYRVSGADEDNYIARAEWEDADDAYSWINTLVFSF